MPYIFLYILQHWNFYITILLHINFVYIIHNITLYTYIQDIYTIHIIHNIYNFIHITLYLFKTGLEMT